MKKVLSLLVTFVLLQTQSWALSGGPVFDQNTASAITGTYAGVLIPNENPIGSTTTSIGLFSLVQPSVGFATGTIVAFVNGAVFNGTIQGIIDPKGSELNGVITATSAYTVTQLVPSGVSATGAVTYTTQAFDVSAEGNINATVKSPSNQGDSTRISGTASMDIFFEVDADGNPTITNTATFQVDGFKQIDPTTGL